MPMLLGNPSLRRLDSESAAKGRFRAHRRPRVSQPLSPSVACTRLRATTGGSSSATPRFGPELGGGVQLADAGSDSVEPGFSFMLLCALRPVFHLDLADIEWCHPGRTCHMQALEDSPAALARKQAPPISGNSARFTLTNAAGGKVPAHRQRPNGPTGLRETFGSTA